MTALEVEASSAETLDESRMVHIEAEPDSFRAYCGYQGPAGSTYTTDPAECVVCIELQRADLREAGVWCR